VVQGAKVSGLVCVAATLTVKACRIRGEHLDGCDGMPCKGCLPYPAAVGCLCKLCDDRLKEALDIAPNLVMHLMSGATSRADVNRQRGKPGPRLPIPAARLAADTLVGALLELVLTHARESSSREPALPPGVTLLDGFTAGLHASVAFRAVTELAVYAGAPTVTARHRPAEFAVRFTREVQRSLARFPLKDAPARIPYLRCRVCRQFAVEDRPPLQYLDVRVHVCAACGAIADPQLREWDLSVYRSEVEAEIVAREAAAS